MKDAWLGSALTHVVDDGIGYIHEGEQAIFTWLCKPDHLLHIFKQWDRVG